jgi:hypothetical protein
MSAYWHKNIADWPISVLSLQYGKSLCMCILIYLKTQGDAHASLRGA